MHTPILMTQLVINTKLNQNKPDISPNYKSDVMHNTRLAAIEKHLNSRHVENMISHDFLQTNHAPLFIRHIVGELKYSCRKIMRYSKMVDQLRRRAVLETLLLWLVRRLMAMQVTLHSTDASQPISRYFSIWPHDIIGKVYSIMKTTLINCFKFAHELHITISC